MKLSDIENELFNQGFSAATVDYYGKKLYKEQWGADREKYTDEERKWAYERGFTAEDVHCLGLNEDNYRDYLSSKDYHSLDPIDPFTKRLVDGKLVIPYTIGGRFKEYLPKYFCWIFDPDTIIPMNDNIVDSWNDVEDYLKKLIDTEKCLAIKPYTGGGGLGFVKMEKIDQRYFCNGDEILDFSSFVKEISDKYLVTEYIHQCDEFNNVWADSAATLRVITISKNNTQKSFVTYVRFGTAISKGACNLASGGVAVPFDWETGEYRDGFYRYLDYCEDGRYIMENHPDSGVSLKGKSIPHFDKVKKLVDDICGFLKVHTFFGFDIMITNDGVKICEINSHPSLDYEQLMFGGIWKQDPFVVDFFASLLEERKKKSF